MLFFADVSIFAQPPFKTRRSHLNDIIFFEFVLFFWSEWVFSVPGSKIKAKKH